MKRENYLSWDTYFMSVALLSSFRSKDPKTQNGACIADTHKKIVGVGYNGLPRGLSDDNPQFWSDDDSKILHSKHTYVVHAEQNAIHNKIVQNISNSSLYVSFFPCKECAKSIIQSGIKRVIFLDIKPHHEEENKAVRIMFKECGVELEKFGDLNLKDKQFIKNLTNLKKELK